MNNFPLVSQLSTARANRSRPGFSLVEVVVSVGIFAVAVLSILALLLPNTKTVADQIDAGVAQRLGENIQLELDRYGFAAVVSALPNKTARIFMVASKDGERVLVTGEDPYAAWDDTYGNNYKSDAAGNYNTVAAPLAAENNLVTATTPGVPPGIAFRDRFFLIEVSWPDTYPQYKVDSGVMPLNVRLLWPYRLPDGPAAPTTTTKYNDWTELPWLVVSPSTHNSLLFNFALKP
jgi:type II secretory pathway pseudopilin PulG